MRKVVAVAGPPERWAALCKEHRQLADFLCVSPVRAEPQDNADFSLFLVDLFSGRFDVLVATCPTAIEAMVGLAKKRKMLGRLREATGRVELVAIGDRTSNCARHHGLTVSSVAPEATTDALVQHLNRAPRRGTAVLLRSDQGSPQMVSDLRSSGWKVEELQVYSLLLDESEGMSDLLDRLEDGKVDVLVFPTPAHAQAFLLQLSLLEGVQVAAMGRETKERLEEHGVKVAMVPERADPAELLRAIVGAIVPR
jgi:uroporphyrinogen-III synthase